MNKVALVSHEFPPYVFGGIGSHCYDLAHSLSKKGVKITVFTGRSSKIIINKINENLKVVRLPFFNIPPRFLWFQYNNLITLSNLLKHYSIIHFVNPLCGGISSYIKKRVNVPIVTTVHGDHRDFLRGLVNSPISNWSIFDFLFIFETPLMEYLSKHCVANSDHIIICAFHTFNKIKKNYHILDPDRYSIIHNGINFEDFESIPSTNNIDNSTIIFYGRLILGKGIQRLIKAFLILTSDFPNLRLEIYGKGPLEYKIKKWVSNLGLKDKIILRGHVNRMKLIREIKKAVIVVLPSQHEVGPFLSALEAMACKKPLILFDYPFTREFITNMQNGILAKAKDEKDLSDKIRVLLLNENLRHKLGQNAYEYVKKKHNWDLLSDKYINIYNNIINKNRKL